MSSTFKVPAPKASKEGQFNVSSFQSMFAQPAGSKPTSSSKKVPAKALQSVEKGKMKAIDSPRTEIEADLSNSLWVDQFAPISREDLSVHPKKLLDLQNWLDEAILNDKLKKYRRLLVLSGPSGSGKTASLRILAKEMGVEVVEFRNGTSHSYEGDVGSESMVQQFTNFLHRAGMSAALDLGPDPTFGSASSSSSSTKAPAIIDTNRKRLILLEDLPNTSHYPTKLALRSALLQFLASPRATCPLVVIVSEAFARPGVGTESESTGGDGVGFGENVDARNVCGVEVLQNHACREISFNPIAVTIMKKALVKILDRIYVNSTPSSHATTVTLSPNRRPSVKTLEIIIANSNGDIRSALMSLEFLAANPATSSGAFKIDGGKESGKGKKRKLDGETENDAKVRELLLSVSARESSLFVFHALGKVLYSKRWGVDDKEDKKDLNRIGIEQEKEQDRLPRHLKQFRRKPSKVNPEVLFAEAPVDSDVFLSYLHHNFPAFTNEIEECVNIVDGMSVADALMRMDGDDFARRAPLTSQYSHAIAVRTTMLSLPSPVPKRKHTMRKSPMWENLRLSKEREDGLEELGNSRAGIFAIGSAESVGTGGQRSRRTLGCELVPWLSMIRGRSLKSSNAFLYEIATFPPAPGDSDFSTRRALHEGETLDEHEVADGEEPEEEEREQKEEKGELETDRTADLFALDDDIED